MEIPIYERLEAYHRKNRISFAMPGHKNLRGLAPNLQICDVTELAATVDLHHESGAVSRANELLRKLYGVRRSFIMTGGSTAGVWAMIMSVMRPGETLLASSDCHMSVVNVCAVCGFGLRLIPTELDADFLVSTDVGEFDITSDVGAVLITSPNYYGKTKEVRKISEKCRAAGVPLLVDEAHGAHLISPRIAGESAVRLGADMVCQSTHKTLCALTGAAYLHICSERVDPSRVARALAMVQSSSPPYPIAASADIARAVLAETDYGDIVKECSDFCEAIERATNIKVFDNDDITRIVLSFAKYDISGFAVSERLGTYYGIDIEMADLTNIVLIATPANTHRDFMSLFNALRGMCAEANESGATQAPLPPSVSGETVAPALGWYGDSEALPLERAVGRRSAVPVYAYPPGTMIILPDGEITYEATEYLSLLSERGAEITGLVRKDDTLMIDVIK